MVNDVKELKGMYYDFCVFGGDKRQVHVAAHLRKKGFKVCTYSLGETLDCCNGIENFQEAVTSSKVIVGPIPLLADQTRLNGVEEGKLDDMIDWMNSGQRFFAGCLPESFGNALQANGISFLDLMKHEGLTVYNSVATAEGALAEAIRRSPVNLHKSKSLVIGYGRCGKRITHVLKALSSEVTVIERNKQARAEAAVYADRAFEWKEFLAERGQYDIIFNTASGRVIGRSFMAGMSLNTVIIDIASAPGGVDFKAAEGLGVPAYLCLGLPGKYAPESSARAIVDVIVKSVR